MHRGIHRNNPFIPIDTACHIWMVAVIHCPFLKNEILFKNSSKNSSFEGLDSDLVTFDAGNIIPDCPDPFLCIATYQWYITKLVTREIIDLV